MEWMDDRHYRGTLNPGEEQRKDLGRDRYYGS